jgi:hypothetical protein
MEFLKRLKERLGLGKFNPEEWDWYEFFKASDKRKEKYWREACNLANSWVTCACGQVCSALPKASWGQPMDDELRQLGSSFDKHIRKRRYGEAEKILDKIESRTVLLLREERNKIISPW